MASYLLVAIMHLTPLEGLVTQQFAMKTRSTFLEVKMIKITNLMTFGASTLQPGHGQEFHTRKAT